MMIAGINDDGHADGIGTYASFNCPSDLAVDPYGNVIVADASNNVIRMISPTGMDIIGMLFVFF